MTTLPSPFARPLWRTVLPWLLALAAALVLLGAVVRTLAQQQLRDGAEAAALRWAGVVAAVSGIDGLLGGAPPRGDTLAQLHRLMQPDEVFRFTLFDARGRTLLSSDELLQPAAAPARGSPGADTQRDAAIQAIVLGGASQVVLHSGAGRPDRPAWYGQAYVPLKHDGRIAGVIEAQVDQTRARAAVHEAYGRVALTVAGLMLVIGAVAGGSGIRRARRRQQADAQAGFAAPPAAPGGTLDRSSFNDALQRAAWRHARTGRAFAVLCLELDGIGGVNEAFGPATGDEVLRNAAQRLRALLRHGDEIARLGRDGFAVLQDGVAAPADVSRLAQRISEQLAAPHLLDDGHIVCGASLGAAMFGSDAGSADELLHQAGLALARARRECRGGFAFYDEALDRELQARRSLLQDLRDALAEAGAGSVAGREAGLRLHYQPLYAPDGRTLLGCEALLRWHHPIHGDLAPEAVIGLADDGGLIEPLGRWVLRTACLEAARWPAGLSLAVNLSAAQFRGEALPAVVAESLAEAGLAPQRLELEVTESLLMHDTDRVLRLLHTLAASGARIVLDDFGSGPSSLAHLWRFPFDKLKIDRGFTQGIAADARLRMVVRSIASFAHALGMRVNVEGVETEAQLRTLQRCGVDELQGFLLGRPVPVDQLDPAGAAERLPERAPAPRSGPMPLDTQPAAL